MSASAAASNARRLAIRSRSARARRVTGAAGRVRYLIERALERVVGATLGHHAKLGRLARQCPAESGGVAEYAVEEVAGAAVVHEGVGERLFGAAECGRCRQPGLTAGARALARGRLGTNLIVLQERQKRHRAPIVLQGLDAKNRQRERRGSRLRLIDMRSTARIALQVLGALFGVLAVLFALRRVAVVERSPLARLSLSLYPRGSGRRRSSLSLRVRGHRPRLGRLGARHSKSD